MTLYANVVHVRILYSLCDVKFKSSILNVLYASKLVSLGPFHGDFKAELSYR